MRILEEFWCGNIEPTEYDTSSNKEYKKLQNHVHRLRPYVSLSSRFYYYVMYMWKQLGLIGGQGIGLQGFSSKALHNLIVPLPSIDEQGRMVDFVDELFETITSIEKSLS